MDVTVLIWFENDAKDYYLLVKSKMQRISEESFFQMIRNGYVVNVKRMTQNIR